MAYYDDNDDNSFHLIRYPKGTRFKVKSGACYLEIGGGLKRGQMIKLEEGEIITWSRHIYTGSNIGIPCFLNSKGLIGLFWPNDCGNVSKDLIGFCDETNQGGNETMATENIISIKLVNGVKLEGTHENVTAILKALGFSAMGDMNHYISSTKGVIKISTMETTHLRNAVLKHYKGWIDSLYAIEDATVLANEIITGLPDITWKSMVAELAKRTPQAPANA